MGKTAFLAILCASCLILKGNMVPQRVFQEREIRVTVDGEAVETPVAPYFAGGEVYVPLRAVSEALGGEVSWIPEEARAEVTAPGLVIDVPFGGECLTANGRVLYAPGGIPVAEGCCMAPAEALAEAFGAFLHVDAEGRRVEMTPTGCPIESGEEFYDGEEVYWLARIIQAEAGGEPFRGKVAVGNVVMNRVAAEEFPDSVKEVIFDRRCGVQFSPAYSGSIYNHPSEESVEAAKAALEGACALEGALYFSPARSSGTSWACRNRPVVAQIGGHVFFG